MVDSYTEIQEDKRNIKDQLGALPEVHTKGIWVYNELPVNEEGATILYTENIAGGRLIWGSNDFGKWGVFRWSRGTTNQSFILGHPTAGVLGTSELGSQSSSPVVVRVVNPNNTFIERFRDITFKDTLETTATWNTTTFKTTFTSGQILQTEEIFLNSQTIYSAKPIIDVDNGVIKIELSADGGSNWQEFTNNIEANFTNTGTDLRCKLTEDNTSTAEVSLIKVEYILT